MEDTTKEKAAGNDSFEKILQKDNTVISTNKFNPVIVDKVSEKFPHWADYNTGLFPCVQNNKGLLTSFRYALFTAFAVAHDWFYKDDNTDQWINGNSNDLDTILNLRGLDTNSEDYAAEKLKAKLAMQCITPSAACDYKKKGEENILAYNPFLQLDFDNLHDFDIEEARQAIFDLPFVCMVQKSVSGFGLWALAMIEEPRKLAAYAEHCFTLFEKYQIPIDTGKGMNPTQLRFLSWDQNVIWRDDPKPLKVKRFNTRKVEVKKSKPVTISSDTSGLIKWAVKEITAAQIGQRFETVRKVAYTLGGHNTGLDEIKQAIEFSSQYQGVTKKYLRHADEGFAAGTKNPIAA